MSTSKKVAVLYFTDILCVWAYIAQVRINELKIKFGSDVIFKEHFVSVFGAVEQKMEQNWGDKGGVAAYCKFIQEGASDYAHVEIHRDIWAKNTPTTSGSCHVLLKAIQILESRNELSLPGDLNNPENTVFAEVAWELRVAFFRDLLDISSYEVQKSVVEKLGLSIEQIQKVIDSGAAHAALDCDVQLKEKHGVVGSPSLVLNEGRQIIYGNVGYRVIEANIQELLSQPENQASWC